jgi:hypothetical protein
LVIENWVNGNEASGRQAALECGATAPLSLMSRQSGTVVPHSKALRAFANDQFSL